MIHWLGLAGLVLALLLWERRQDRKFIDEYLKEKGKSSS